MKHFYTDGIKTIKLDIENGDIIPDGFKPGRVFNVNPWNRGLDKNDPRVKANTDKCHATRRATNNYHSWNKGLTAEENNSLKKVAEKVSAARIGKSSWNKGIPASEERKQKQSATMRAKDRTSSEYLEKLRAANEKSNATKRQNNSFNTSKLEEERYLEYCDQYGAENVKRQYIDPRYPYKVDFYIANEDLFIELNGTWTHGPHPFDENNEEDIKLLNQWKEKAETSRYYKLAINVWTVKDKEKLETMRSNNLRFIIEYPKVTISNI